MELISQPSVDTSLSNPYLPISPLDCLESGNYLKDVEIMLGYNEDDGVLITQFFVSAPSLYDFLKASWRTVGQCWSPDFSGYFGMNPLKD